ncbi:hypothetical protein MAL08_04810 [Leptospira noguchii]|nr:hypothetical protein [Leptospira noguchii]UOG39609.1 hypothetical protein MAL08_04810 [Leptospira noguchii]
MKIYSKPFQNTLYLFNAAYSKMFLRSFINKQSTNDEIISDNTKLIGDEAGKGMVVELRAVLVLLHDWERL